MCVKLYKHETSHSIPGVLLPPPKNVYKHASYEHVSLIFAKNEQDLWCTLMLVFSFKADIYALHLKG